MCCCAVASLDEAFEVVRLHGHVAAVLNTLRRLGLERVLDTQALPERDFCDATICSGAAYKALLMCLPL